jgi:hypothetical protein
MSFRGHSSQPSESGSWQLAPLSLTNTLAVFASFAVQGAQDAVKLQVAGAKVAQDKVRNSLYLPLPSYELLSRLFLPTLTW